VRRGECSVWAHRSGRPSGITADGPVSLSGVGENRGNRSIVRLSFETGGKGRRIANELFWRNLELKGKDKPR
jgi:hypothetical protein